MVKGSPRMPRSPWMMRRAMTEKLEEMERGWEGLCTDSMWVVADIFEDNVGIARVPDPSIIESLPCPREFQRSVLVDAA